MGGGKKRYYIFPPADRIRIRTELCERIARFCIFREVCLRIASTSKIVIGFTELGIASSRGKNFEVGCTAQRHFSPPFRNGQYVGSNVSPFGADNLQLQ